MYVLEFFHLPSDGGDTYVRLGSERRRIQSAEVARKYALAAMENVLFNGMRANLCHIKNRDGTLICEVRRSAVRH